MLTRHRMVSERRLTSGKSILVGGPRTAIQLTASTAAGQIDVAYDERELPIMAMSWRVFHPELHLVLRAVLVIDASELLLNLKHMDLSNLSPGNVYLRTRENIYSRREFE